MDRLVDSCSVDLDIKGNDKKVKEMAEHLRMSLKFVGEFTEKDIKGLAVELLQQFT